MQTIPASAAASRARPGRSASVPWHGYHGEIGRHATWRFLGPEAAAILACVPLPTVELKVRVNGRHPWFFRKMVKKPDRPIPAGSAVLVTDRTGRSVGTAFYNPRTELALRLFSDAAETDPVALLVGRLEQALALREDVLRLPEVTDAYRVVHAEGDGIPAFVLDRFGSAYVAQVGSLGVFQVMEELGQCLRRRTPGCRLVLVPDRDGEHREGIERLSPPDPFQVEIHEHGLLFSVQAGGGHKTGFFADQRDNRQLVRRLSKGRHVLDLCCYTGGFACNAAAGQARTVCAVDLDEEATAMARDNLARNQLHADVVHDDAFDVLRELRPGRADLIVLDPPKWVPQPAALMEGLVRYRDLNRLAFEKLPEGGLLLTCSCSGSVSEEDFLRTLRDAAADAGADARVLAVRGAGPDHPFALECQETRYLKAVLLQVR
jgi:23S rRNA (cytosine1962-C5)-methyltransferase